MPIHAHGSAWHAVHTVEAHITSVDARRNYLHNPSYVSAAFGLRRRHRLRELAQREPAEEEAFDRPEDARLRDMGVEGLWPRVGDVMWLIYM